ncbi:phage portal protein, HK97 family [Singulisphaera sp. GP187]|nr:phage portal protein, HK97 family [Singulisphaera sp. GP187]
MGLGTGSVPGAPVLSGTYVTPQTAMALTAVYASINLISKDMATLPLGLYQKLPDGGVRLDPTNYYDELLGVETDDNTSSLKFTLDTQGHTLGQGNGYAEVVRDTRGRAEALHILHPAKTIPKQTESGRLYYLLDNKRELLAENVLHFAGLGFNGILGYTPLTIARQTVGLALAAEQFGASFFGNSAIPKGILKFPKRLKEEAQNNIRRSINQVHQGTQSSHQFMILEEGTEYTQTQISPEDAQFLGTRQFQVLEIARLYGVPPHKIGDYSQSHMSNIEQSNLDYWTTTLAFWVAMREGVLNRRLLTRDDRRKWVIRYDMSALLRGDTAARMAMYQALRNLGAINADEIRLGEGMPPIGPEKGGDKYLVQSQYNPLDQAGKSTETTPKARLIKQGSRRKRLRRLVAPTSLR